MKDTAIWKCVFLDVFSLGGVVGKVCVRFSNLRSCLGMCYLRLWVRGHARYDSRKDTPLSTKAYVPRLTLTPELTVSQEAALRSELEGIGVELVLGAFQLRGWWKSGTAGDLPSDAEAITSANSKRR